MGNYSNNLLSIDNRCKRQDQHESKYHFLVFLPLKKCHTTALISQAMGTCSCDFMVFVATKGTRTHLDRTHAKARIQPGEGKGHTTNFLC